MDSEQLKARLLELIKGSTGMNSISAKEKSERTTLMLAGSDEDIQGYIEIFEEELAEVEQIEKEEQGEAEKAHEMINEKKHEIADFERLKRLQKELTRQDKEKRKSKKILDKLENA